MFVEKTKFCFPASECQYQDKAEGGGGGEAGRGVRVGEPLQCEWKGKRERGQLNKKLREETWKVEIFFLASDQACFLGQNVPTVGDVLLPHGALYLGTTGSSGKGKEISRLRSICYLQELPTFPCLWLTMLCWGEFIPCHIYTRYCFLLMAYLLQI